MFLAALVAGGLAANVLMIGSSAVEASASAPLVSASADPPGPPAMPAAAPSALLTSSIEGAVSSEPTPPRSGRVPACKGTHGQRIGWAVAVPFLLGKGDVWRPMVDKRVYADRPRASNGFREQRVVCTLPRGTRVRLEESPVPVGGSGTWIAIYGQ